MNAEHELESRLLELYYGLLEEAEAVELRRRIAAEPELARAWAEVQRTAALFGEAARAPVNLAPVELRRPEGPSRKAGKARLSEPTPPTKVTGLPSPWNRRLSLGIGVAAGILLAFTGIGYFSARTTMDLLMSERTRLVVLAPSRMEPGLDQRITVMTQDATGQPKPTKVEARLRDQNDQVVSTQTIQTNERGQAWLDVGSDPRIVSGWDLVVQAPGAPAAEKFDLGFSSRNDSYCFAHLGTDKPLYQPGETIHYRALLLGRARRNDFVEASIDFSIEGPSGQTVPGSETNLETEQGVASGSFIIPRDIPGGRFTLIGETGKSAASAERLEFDIREYRLPRLKKELEFARDSYGLGDRVVADFAATRAEGGAAAGADLEIVATVDGKQVFTERKKSDGAGTFQIAFDLPNEIERGEGLLAVVVDDGGNRETIAKRIPIQLRQVQVAFYPEGGELVAGLTSQVYFEARDSLDKPIEIEGRVVDRSGREVARVVTEHEGMGVFEIEPAPGEDYILEITKPAGITSRPKLPLARGETPGIVLSAKPGVFEADGDLVVSIRSTRPGRPLVVSALSRGHGVGQAAVLTDGRDQSATIPLVKDTEGVIRVTVHDLAVQPPRPLAERLVYRGRTRRLDIQVDGPARPQAPGEKVELALAITDEERKPVSAVLGVSVVDDALLSLVNKKTASLPTHYFLTSEIREPEDLEDADFFLSGDPKAAKALDLVLGTRGWRRFVESERSEQEKKYLARREEIEGWDELDGEESAPYVIDNNDELLTEREWAMVTALKDQTRRLGRWTLIGGAALALMGIASSLAHWTKERRVWSPSLGTALACACLGLVLLRTDHGWMGGGVSFEPPEDYTPLPFSETLGRAAGGGGGGGFGGHAPEPLRENGAVDVIALKDNAARLGEKPLLDLFGANEDVDRVHRFFEYGQAGQVRYLMGLKQKVAGVDRLHEFEEGVPLQLGARLVPGQQAAVIREYAHVYRPRRDGVRSDFAETLYWNPLLVTDAQGKGRIAFDLSDAVTTFRVRVEGHDSTGRLGTDEGAVISRLPLSVEPKLPVEVGVGDRIDAPLTLTNDGTTPLATRLHATAEAGLEALGRESLLRLLEEEQELMSSHGEEHPKVLAVRKKIDLFTQMFKESTSITNESTEWNLDIAPGMRRRTSAAFKAVSAADAAPIELAVWAVVNGSSGPRMLEDAVRRTVRVVDRGFPVKGSYSGILSGETDIVVQLPEKWEPGSLAARLHLFPSPLADLAGGLESILQEPSGCFEQASSSNYPNVLTLDYLQRTGTASPELTRKARTLLDKGYAKLVGYECSQRGYEWFGHEPAHEALTAYGILEFHDMAKVHPVDLKMLARTREWLLTRRDGKGGFQRNVKALDHFGGAPPDVTDAYITWALAQAGARDLERELDHAFELGQRSADPYVIALTAGALAASERPEPARELLTRLAALQAADGHFDGKAGSITRSGGKSLAVETTALAVHALLEAPEHVASASKAADWLVGQRQDGGGFGSTQATILALKALLRYAEKNAGKTDARVQVSVDGQTIWAQDLRADARGLVTIPGIEAALRPGKNTVRLAMTGEGRIPYSLSVQYHSDSPVNDPDCPVRIAAALDQEVVRAGATVKLQASLTNATASGQPMTVAILGIPGGLEARTEPLDELVKAGTISFYELRAREIILYWRALAPQQKVDVALDLVAAVPGSYTGPPAHTYLYYTAERKHWATPLTLEITPVE